MLALAVQHRGFLILNEHPFSNENVHHLPRSLFLAQRIDQSCLCLQVRRIDDIWDLEEFFLTQELLEGLMEGKKWKQFWERKLNRWSFFTREKNEPIENRMKVNKNETFQSMNARPK